MHAIKRIRHQIETAPESDSTHALMGLVVALTEAGPVNLGSLYRMDRSSFELAMELLQDWRIERLFADQVPEFSEVCARAQRQPALHA
jgi:hypothetical protein